MKRSARGEECVRSCISCLKLFEDDKWRFALGIDSNVEHKLQKRLMSYHAPVENVCCILETLLFYRMEGNVMRV